MRNWNVTSPKDETQAGLFCECSGNIELHLAAKSLKYRFPSTVRGLRETVLLESGTDSLERLIAFLATLWNFAGPRFSA